MLDVGRLRLLREVAIRGTIAAAARACGLTASAVSQQLAVLEREAGARLLDRSSRGVALTGAGHALVERAGQVLDVLASARADLDRLGDSVTGAVRIASVASAAAAIVSPAVLSLHERQPGISIAVVAAEPARSLELLQHDDVEIAIVDEYDYVPVALPESMQADELAVEELVVVLPSPATANDPPEPVDLAELLGRDWVMPPDDAACGQAVRSACRSAGFEPRVSWETDDMLLLTRAVAAGHGIAILPRSAVATGIGGVALRPLRRPVLRRKLIALSRTSTRSRPVVAAVLAELARAAAG
jgi:DNA-binding transcriptional LysR family regulator